MYLPMLGPFSSQSSRKLETVAIANYMNLVHLRLSAAAVSALRLALSPGTDRDGDIMRKESGMCCVY